MLTNVRPRAKSRLLEAAGSVREVFYADDRQYEQLGFLTPEECRVLAENKDLGAAKRVIAACAEQDVGIITMQDAAYPRRLSEIYDPPMVLYVKGRHALRHKDGRAHGLRYNQVRRPRRLRPHARRG